MQRFSHLLLAAILPLLAACGGEEAEKEKLSKITDTMQVSTMQVHPRQRKQFDPEELKQNKASVFIFMTPDCPLCQGYVPTIMHLDSVFAPDNIRFYAVFPGKTYSDADVTRFFSDYKLDLPYFIDETYMLTDFMRATTTPQAFIVNPEGRVVYGGRIDNWAYEIGKKRTVVTEHDLEDALNDVRAGKEIRVKSSVPVGCIIEKKEQQ